METIDTKIQETIHGFINVLQQANKGKFKSNGAFDWEIDGLKDYLNEDIRKCPVQMETFDKLQQITGPTLYWVELLNQSNKKELIDRFKSYRFSGTARNTPSCKTTIDYQSNILYVGKVQKDFWGRIILHLGFHKSRRTQGLQLYHWAKGHSLQVRVHYREYPTSMSPLMGALEYQVAKELKPLLGSHK